MSTKLTIRKPLFLLLITVTSARVLNEQKRRNKAGNVINQDIVIQIYPLVLAKVT